ncbi:hypothetical protein A2U01_0045966, partial [Trifolium medium]|nr:hypothetical protein [Trifolium medium]
MLPCLPVNQRLGEHPGPSLEPKTNDHDPPSTEHEPPTTKHEPPATEDEPTPTEHEPTPKEPADEGGAK